MYKVMRGYSILGSSEHNSFDGTNIQSALVMVETIPHSRVFLGCADTYGGEDEIYQRVAAMGDELSFSFIEKLYLKMKAEREEKNV